MGAKFFDDVVVEELSGHFVGEVAGFSEQCSIKTKGVYRGSAIYAFFRYISGGDSPIPGGNGSIWLGHRGTAEP